MARSVDRGRQAEARRPRRSDSLKEGANTHGDSSRDSAKINARFDNTLSATCGDLRLCRSDYRRDVASQKPRKYSENSRDQKKSLGGYKP
jgi:hypothetical protein